VVFRPAHGKHLHAMIAPDACKVAPQAGLMVRGNELCPLFVLKTMWKTELT
jgi:hypothetical protein